MNTGIFPYSLGYCFILRIFFLLCRSFLDTVPLSISACVAFLFIFFWCHIQEIAAKISVKELFSYVFFQEFTFLWLPFKSLSKKQTHNKGPISFFCIYLLSFVNIIYCRDCHFLTKYSWLLCQVLVNHICKGLFVSYHSVPLVCACILMPVPYCFHYQSFV